MHTSRRSLLKILAAGAIPQAAVHGAAHTYAVDGDHFALDGKPFVVRSGEMHYARVPREYWRDRMKKMRAMGLNTLCLYSFWNLHEPRPGEYDFSGNLDIATYIKTAQEEGLWVIVRPGPYSCAEWEFGGFPWWLWQTPGIKVRTTDPRFLVSSGKYMKRLLAEVAPLQITRGGPVIMVQVENEYGSFGNDHEYVGAIRKMISESGIEVTLYTADGSSAKMLSGGTLPDLPAVVNFGGAPQREFDNLAKFRSTGPRMCGEYWVGWFDHWGEKHHTGNNSVHLAGIDWMLERNIGFNLYMVHGGTTPGFMNGANFEMGGNGGYQPDVSSYDYDSPIDEAGRTAPKFKLYRDVIGKHLAPGETLPPLPEPLPMIAIPRFELTESAPLFDLLRDPVQADAPKTFEELGQGYGLVLYRTKSTKATNAKLEINELRDYGIVYENGKWLGKMDRRLHQNSLDVTLNGGGNLDILVENMGRVNFGPKLLDDRKGITQNVTQDGKALSPWSMFRLPLNDLKGLVFSRGMKTGPGFYRGDFQLQDTGDTFFDMRGCGKGNVWVNGHNLGRHWKIGPQRSAFCPGVWLNKGRNEIIVLDLDEGGPESIAAWVDPIWETQA
jgi:beta-galactosidase